MKYETVRRNSVEIVVEWSKAVEDKLPAKHGITVNEVILSFKTSPMFQVRYNPHQSKPGRENQRIILVRHPDGWPMAVVVRIFGEKNCTRYKIITAYRVSRHSVVND